MHNTVRKEMVVEDEKKTEYTSEEQAECCVENERKRTI